MRFRVRRCTAVPPIHVNKRGSDAPQRTRCWCRASGPPSCRQCPPRRPTPAATATPTAWPPRRRLRTATRGRARCPAAPRRRRRLARRLTGRPRLRTHKHAPSVARPSLCGRWQLARCGRPVPPQRAPCVRRTCERHAVGHLPLQRHHLLLVHAALRRHGVHHAPVELVPRHLRASQRGGRAHVKRAASQLEGSSWEPGACSE